MDFGFSGFMGIGLELTDFGFEASWIGGFDFTELGAFNLEFRVEGILFIAAMRSQHFAG